MVNVCSKVAPTGRLPLSNFPLSVTVCGTLPAFFQITIVPTVIVRWAGLKPESVTVTRTIVGGGFGVGVAVGVGTAALVGVAVGVGVGA